MIRTAIVALAIGSCGRGPAQPATRSGANRESAIPLAIGADMAQRPATELPRWYSVVLPADHPSAVSALVYYDGPPQSVSVDLLDASGAQLTTATTGVHDRYSNGGSRSASFEPATGTMFVRVTGGAGAVSYRLEVTALARTTPPPPVVDCVPTAIDPANPRCAGVVGCDANQPDFANPACCVTRCGIGKGCSGQLTNIAGTAPFAWLALGAKHGINRRYTGAIDAAGTDGKRHVVPLVVVGVEAERSRVLLPMEIDRAHLDQAYAMVRPPLECGPSP